ncbi:unnamed protein product [Penicillium bialowiezense]
MGVSVLSGKAQFFELIASDDVTIIEFWATWCGPCRIIAPVFEKLSETTSGPKFYKVDADQEEEISQEAGVRAMPTFMAFKDGEKVGELVGANPQKLMELVGQFAS